MVAFFVDVGVAMSKLPPVEARSSPLGAARSPAAPSLDCPHPVTHNSVAAAMHRAIMRTPARLYQGARASSASSSGPSGCTTSGWIVRLTMVMLDASMMK